jgi:polar amino acid transport system substrate-binding protein
MSDDMSGARPWAARGRAALLALTAMAMHLPAEARTLAEIQARGMLALCANPDALPHASNRPDAPGFQIEIGRALSAALNVQLHIDWIIPRLRANLVECDMLLDTIVDPATQRGPVRLSVPYQKSGVALALGAGNDAVRRFDDLAPDKRIGVMINSLASKLLNQRGLRTVPYAFEGDMVADLAKGEIDAAAVSPATIAYYIRQHAGAPLRYVHAYDAEPELRWDLAVGLRRSDDALVAAVNTALAGLMRDGTLARIYGAYGIEHRQP